MRVAQQFAGYSLADADNLRKACGKKKREVMAAERAKFVDGCETTGYGRDARRATCSASSRRSPTTPSTSPTPSATGSSPTRPPTSRRTTRSSTSPPSSPASRPTSTRPRSTSTSAASWASRCSCPTSTARRPTSSRPGSTTAPRSSRSASRRSATSAARWSTRSSPSATPAGRSPTSSTSATGCRCTVLNKKTLESLIKAGGFDSLGHPRQGLLAVFESIIDTTVARRREDDQGVMSLFGDARRGGGGLRRPARRSPTAVREDREAPLREGDARALRLRPPAHGQEDALRRRTETTIRELIESVETAEALISAGEAPPPGPRARTGASGSGS